MPAISEAPAGAAKGSRWWSVERNHRFNLNMPSSPGRGGTSAVHLFQFLPTCPASLETLNRHPHKNSNSIFEINPLALPFSRRADNKPARAGAALKKALLKVRLPANRGFELSAEKLQKP
jgi:hypothetical protein